MKNNHFRRNALVLMLALCALAFSGCSLLGDDTKKANKLVEEASAEIKAADQIEERNKGKMTEYQSALQREDFPAAKKILDDGIKEMDTGINHGKKAAEKLEEASRMNLKDKFKEYLTQKALMVRKKVEIAEETRRMLNVTSEMLGNPTPESAAKAQPEIQKSQERIATLTKEAEEADRKAEEIRKNNPEVFEKS